MQSREKVVGMLRENGMKITPQRLAILDTLTDNTSHPSAESIHQDILSKYPSMSLTTVYNTLDILLEIGEIRELCIDRGRRHYDPDTSVHHHAICRKCGLIHDIFEDFGEHIEKSNLLDGDFINEGYELIFFGTCKSCN